MLSVGAICFEDRFCTSKRWDGEGGWSQSQHAVHMVAVLASYRKALVGTGMTIFLTLLAQLKPLVLTLVGHYIWYCRQFLLGGAFSGQRHSVGVHDLYNTQSLVSF